MPSYDRRDAIQAGAKETRYSVFMSDRSDHTLQRLGVGDAKKQKSEIRQLHLWPKKAAHLLRVRASSCD